jgi:hypothetical protein
MSRHGEVTVSCWDGDYTFRLAYGELRELQEATNIGAWRLAERLLPRSETNPHGGECRVEDVRETIRMGLIGGGKTQNEALDLVRKHVEPHLEGNRLLAWAVISQGLIGATDEPIMGKALGAETKANGSQTEKSPSLNSTALPQ